MNLTVPQRRDDIYVISASFFAQPQMQAGFSVTYTVTPSAPGMTLASGNDIVPSVSNAQVTDLPQT